MSVSYGIVRRHNGFISVSSEEGSGTTLTITLPLCPDDQIGEEGRIASSE